MTNDVSANLVQAVTQTATTTPPQLSWTHGALALGWLVHVNWPRIQTGIAMAWQWWGDIGGRSGFLNYLARGSKTLPTNPPSAQPKDTNENK